MIESQVVQDAFARLSWTLSARQLCGAVVAYREHPCGLTHSLLQRAMDDVHIAWLDARPSEDVR